MSRYVIRFDDKKQPFKTEYYALGWFRNEFNKVIRGNGPKERWTNDINAAYRGMEVAVSRFDYVYKFWIEEYSGE